MTPAVRSYLSPAREVGKMRVLSGSTFSDTLEALDERAAMSDSHAEKCRLGDHRALAMVHEGHARIDRAAAAWLREAAELLGQAREHIAGEVDVVDGDYGEPAPNRAMQLTTAINAVLP